MLRNLRVLHCPMSVASHGFSMAAAERALGVESWSVALEEPSLGMQADQVMSKPGRSLLRAEWDRFSLFYEAIRNYDVIHYNFGNSILNWGSLDGRHWKVGAGAGGVYAYLNKVCELRLLKRLGKVIAVTYQGDDARQGDFIKANYDAELCAEVPHNYYSKVTDRAKRERIERFAAHADLIYALNPDLLPLLPKRAKFVPYLHNLSSFNASSWNDRGSVKRPFRIVHAPTNREVKGTRFVIDAVNELKTEGWNIELRLIEGLVKAEAQLQYAKADLVIDQLLVGWYGALAVECMALGKPVMSFLRQVDCERIPPNMLADLPIINVNHKTLKDSLGTFMHRAPGEHATLGDRGKNFVKKWHDPVSIVTQIVQDYSDIISGEF